jgi:hypothetical protein
MGHAPEDLRPWGPTNHFASWVKPIVWRASATHLDLIPSGNDLLRLPHQRSGVPSTATNPFDILLVLITVVSFTAFLLSSLLLGPPTTKMATSIAPRALTAFSRPTVLAPTLRNARGHAAAVDPPSHNTGTAASGRRYADGDVRNNWRRSEIQRIFDAPLMETIYRAVSRGSQRGDLLRCHSFGKACCAAGMTHRHKLSTLGYCAQDAPRRFPHPALHAHEHQK